MDTMLLTITICSFAHLQLDTNMLSIVKQTSFLQEDSQDSSSYFLSFSFVFPFVLDAELKSECCSNLMNNISHSLSNHWTVALLLILEINSVLALLSVYRSTTSCNAGSLPALISSPLVVILQLSSNYAGYHSVFIIHSVICVTFHCIALSPQLCWCFIIDINMNESHTISPIMLFPHHLVIPLH